MHTEPTDLDLLQQAHQVLAYQNRLIDEVIEASGCPIDRGLIDWAADLKRCFDANNHRTDR